MNSSFDKAWRESIEYINIGNICFIYIGKQLNRKDMIKEGKYSVMNGGVLPVGYTNNYNQNENTIIISQGGSSAGYVGWSKEKFWAGAHCYVVKPTNKVLNRYLYYFLKSREFIFQKQKYGAAIPSLKKTEILASNIFLPPLKGQARVVGILDKFFNLIHELKKEYLLRIKQYKYFSNMILNRHSK